MATETRKTAEARREELVAIAIEEFAERGLHGTSTDDIARRAGISQPYLFRLFGTKKELFRAAVERCLGETLETMREASAGLEGEEALEAMGSAYMELLADRSRLRAQMQAYAACEDADIREAVRAGYGRLVEHVEAVSGAPRRRVTRFFAMGMLINVIASLELREAGEPWAKRLIDGCKEENE
jgi:AcrR family transcriptional regulator